MTEAAELLRATLEEEKATDAILSELALSEINVAADQGDGSADQRKRGDKSKKRAA